MPLVYWRYDPYYPYYGGEQHWYPNGEDQENDDPEGDSSEDDPIAMMQSPKAAKPTNLILDEFVAELKPEEVGLDVSDGVARAVNLVWQTLHGSDAFKEAARRHKRQRNTELYRVGLDDEIYNVLKPAPTRSSNHLIGQWNHPYGAGGQGSPHEAAARHSHVALAH